MRTAKGVPELPDALVARFWSKVDRSGDCWLWMGGRTKVGDYGRFYIAASPSLAHRVAYTIAFGPMPDGYLVDHICRNKPCVRPDHLRLTTSKQNMENHAGDTTARSGIRNVHWNEQSQKWTVTVRSGGKRIFGGYFRDKEEAGRVAKSLRNQMHTHNDLDRK